MIATEDAKIAVHKELKIARIGSDKESKLVTKVKSEKLKNSFEMQQSELRNRLVLQILRANWKSKRLKG